MDWGERGGGSLDPNSVASDPGALSAATGRLELKGLAMQLMQPGRRMGPRPLLATSPRPSLASVPIKPATRCTTLLPGPSV